MPTEAASQTRLLKANDVRGLGSKGRPSILTTLRHASDEYVESIGSRSSELLANAQSDVDTLRQSGQAPSGCNRAGQEGLKPGRHGNRAAETRR